MNARKIVLAVAVLAGVAASGAYAKDEGHGTVTFTGDVAP